MPLVFYNGSILFSNGQPAMSTSCCCGQDCCGCEWLRDYYTANPANRVRITFTGALTGYMILDQYTPVENCYSWFGNDVTAVVDNCDMQLRDAFFYCKAGATGTDGMVLVIRGYALGLCDFSHLASTELQPDSVSCGPPLSVVYTSSTAEVIPGGCLACGDGTTITMTISNEDPWP